MTTKTEQIRELNDRLRQNFSEGTAVLTCGVAALGAEAVARCHANDPHQEHDFGAFEADGHEIFFKIDYYGQYPHLSFARCSRPICHRACDHHYAG
jgi:hypothetical protein